MLRLGNICKTNTYFTSHRIFLRLLLIFFCYTMRLPRYFYVVVFNLYILLLFSTNTIPIIVMNVVLVVVLVIVNLSSSKKFHFDRIPDFSNRGFHT